MPVQNPVASVCPAIGDEVLEMARFVDVDGRGRKGIMGFEARIGWIRECRTDLLLEHGGVLVTEKGSYIDVGTWGSAVTGGMEYALDLCERYGITPASSLLARLAATVTEVPVLMPEQGDAPREFGRFQYEALPGDWMAYDRPRIEECLRYRGAEGRGCWPEGGLPTIRKRNLAECETVWSSQLDGAGNRSLAEEFQQRWAPLRA